MFCLAPKAAPVLFTPRLKFNETLHVAGGGGGGKEKRETN